MPGKIRTLNPQIRSLILYPIEPQAPSIRGKLCHIYILVHEDSRYYPRIRLIYST